MRPFKSNGSYLTDRQRTVTSDDQSKPKFQHLEITMNEYTAKKEIHEQKYMVAANGPTGDRAIAFKPITKKQMLERFQDVDELVGRIEVAIAVAA